MHRAAPTYDVLCGLCFRKMKIVKIQYIPIALDDGLGGWRCQRDISGTTDIRIVSRDVLCACDASRRSGAYVVFSSSASDLSHHFPLGRQT
jgi:hypothetical protein